MQTGPRAVERDVRGDAPQRPQPPGHLIVNEPAVGVKCDADAGLGQRLDHAQGQLLAQKRLTAGDDGLDDAELERLVHHLAPLLIAQLGRALQGVPGRVGVTEAAAQVAGIGQLELGPDWTIGYLGQRSRGTAAESPEQPPPAEAVLAAPT